MTQNTNVPPPVEIIPSQADGISGIASAHAPFLYFDRAPTFGHNHGVINISLEALRYMAVGNVPTRDRVVVAHLRMSIPAALSLKAAIEGALLLARPPGGPQASPSGGPTKPN